MPTLVLDLESSSMCCNLPLVEWPMRNIETFPSKHMYLYLSLVERKVAEFYHNMVKMTYFHRFLQTIDGVLIIVIIVILNYYLLSAATFY